MQREHPALNYLGGKGVSLDSILRQRKAVQDALIQTRTQQKTVKRRCDCCLISLIDLFLDVQTCFDFKVLFFVPLSCDYV